jgi:hypothetical protein
MKYRIFSLLIISTLIFSNLGCKFFTQRILENETNSPSQPGKDSSQIKLGEVFTSTEGGYSFRSIPGYSLEELWGISTMVAPDGSKESGPLITLVGGINYEPRTTRDVFDSFVTNAIDVQVSNQGFIPLAGVQVIEADLSGEIEGVAVLGRILVAMITDTQQFSMLAIAPVDRWSDISPYYDAIYNTLEFFEPEEECLAEPTSEPDLPEPTKPPMTNIPPNAPSPSDLAPGEFIFIVTGADQDATIESGFVQDQSIPGEFVIGLMQSGDFARYFLTLFLKTDTQAGGLEMLPYDKSKTPKGPTAAIFIGAWYYYATKGSFQITEINNQYVSGIFSFEGAREGDANITISVTGAFNQIPIVWK